MEPEKFTWDSGKAIISQFIGFLLDSYDLTMILSIAPVLAKVILPPASPLIATFNIILSYSLTIIFRPLGSAIFGNLGDKIGRRADLIITVLGLGITSALTSALPTYAQAGILSFVLFVLIRVAVGIFAGGEYSAGHPFAGYYPPWVTNPSAYGLNTNTRQTSNSTILFLLPFLALSPAIANIDKKYYLLK
ncbi:hypothetical protein LS215_2623 [Sulfolobus islandicus L.S.2.15]|uniref:Major facilitator superfamily (MFS) profile domain-containing protein n=1 Tax=Saccharolobus islandicus (strain L.S.2.15 / Lassen \|nr:hypothetical protein LS215_2623 [Sulfolobus islandicus L.S.2.15]